MANHAIQLAGFTGKAASVEAVAVVRQAVRETAFKSSKYRSNFNFLNFDFGDTNRRWRWLFRRRYIWRVDEWRRRNLVHS